MESKKVRNIKVILQSGRNYVYVIENERLLPKEDAVKVAEIIVVALETWFAGKGDADVHEGSAGTA